MRNRKSKFKSFRSSKWSPEGTVEKWPQIRITILRIRIRIRIDVKSRTVIRIQEKSWIRIRNPFERKQEMLMTDTVKKRSSVVEP
jgi:hypothetical protein